MTSLLLAFLLVLLAPLFLANWRTSLAGLAGQGVLLAAMNYRLHGAELTAANLLSVVDLAVLRGLVAPVVLYRVLQDRNAPDRNDVLPPNMLAWAAAIGVVLLAFRVASDLVPLDSDARMLTAVCGSGVLLGFLVLATQVGVFSQIIGVLRLENAVALFELGLPERSGDAAGFLGLALGQALVYLATIALCRYYLHEAPVVAIADPAPEFDDD